MKLSLSGRLVEGGTGTILTAERFLKLARDCGYEAIDLRATQLGPETDAVELEHLRDGLKTHKLELFEGQHRGGLDAVGQEAFSQLAERVAYLGGRGIRVGGDLATLKHACRLAAPHGLRILYQMHTNGPFETVLAAAAAIAEIDEPNFGVMPEPSNLLMAGETFSQDMFAPLTGRIFGVHVQTLEVHPDAPNALRLTDGTEVRYLRVPYAENRQIDFAVFFAALRQAGFSGYVNELEPCPGEAEVEATVSEAAAFLRPLLT